MDENGAKRSTKTGLPWNVPPKFAHLLGEANVARWHGNLAMGSPRTAKDYLRALGVFLEARSETPASFVAHGQDACEDILHDWVRVRIQAGQAGSTVDYYVSVVQSWLKWNRIPIRRTVKIPQLNYNPRVKTFYIPSMEELRRVLALCDGRQKMTLALLAYAGIRPGAIGNMSGTDGLTFADLLDVRLVDGKPIFDKIPCRIRVREELSKAKHEYFTLIGPEGCDYIAAYAGQRVSKGEPLTPASALLHSQHQGNRFMFSESIGDLLRRPMREAGVVLPPYIWRSYFNNRALLAEADGFVRDYRVFFMGHRGDMEHVYALRKRIGDDMIAKMREAYAKAVPYLESRMAAPKENPMRRIAQVFLEASGMPSEKVKDLDLDAKSEAELVNLLVDSMQQQATHVAPPSRHTASQQIVSLEEMRVLLARGWRFTNKLAEDAYVVETPA